MIARGLVVLAQSIRSHLFESHAPELIMAETHTPPHTTYSSGFQTQARFAAARVPS